MISASKLATDFPPGKPANKHTKTLDLDLYFNLVICWQRFINLIFFE